MDKIEQKIQEHELLRELIARATKKDSLFVDFVLDRIEEFQIEDTAIAFWNRCTALYYEKRKEDL